MNKIQIKNDYKNILIFTHNDADGILGAYVVKHYFDNNLENNLWDNNVKVYCCSYGKQFNLSFFKNKIDEFIEEYHNNIQIYMIDYAIQPNNEMIKLNNWITDKGLEFFWIDHHITAIENLLHYNIPGFTTDKHAGCLNTWLFLNKKKTIDNEVPKILMLVNDFDIWNKKSKFSWETEIWPIILFLNSLGLDLNDNNGSLVKVLKSLFGNDNALPQYIDFGTNIYNYVKCIQNQNVKKIYNKEWNGYSCLVLNTTMSGSSQFENHPDYNNSDLLITWSFDGKYYYYGVYTTKNIDVGEICETYFNGGGHKSCGGGQLKKLIV